MSSTDQRLIATDEWREVKALAASIGPTTCEPCSTPTPGAALAWG